MAESMTYKRSGVDYEAMDPFKRMCQLAALETRHNLARFGFAEVEESRGESCYLIKTPFGFLAHVEEGLGTKNLVADAVDRLGIATDIESETGVSHYSKVAQCAVAAIVNDMITVGALPISVAMHLAAGDKSWFKNLVRQQSLVDGFKEGCNEAGAVWGGGETPTLPGMINPETVVMAGSAMGIITPFLRRVTMQLTPGTVIILLLSSGVHANGLTLCREIAAKLENGYATMLPDGTLYGETLLTPTTIYVKTIEDMMDAGIPIRYMANITGHGWRKLMRSPESFVYVIDQIPDPHPIFNFIAKQGPVDQREMYGNFNMGAGFAVYVGEEHADQVIAIAQKRGIGAMKAGHVEKRGDEKKVQITPLGITFDRDELKLKG